MKAKDLMIGDWVQAPCLIDNTENYNAWCQIKQLRDCDLDVVGFKELSYDEIEPIPITPEILEKNGFEKVLDEDGTECHRYYNSAADGYIKISLYNGGDGDWSIEIINYEKFDDNEIVYNNNFTFLKVHQLQQAFRLCGITKEIEP